jgi:ferredoxin-NADP reductase
MATRGPNDMDVNHRGGQAGFVRVSIDGEMTLYIPDYSGNQLFSTLGNIESTAVAGVTVPRFDTGDVLYMTGEAVNVFGNEAAKLMPGVQRLTRIKVTHCQFIAQGLNLKLDDEGVSMSPYNPPIFRLASEPGQRLPQADFSNTATLIQMQSISPTINRYTWKLSTPVSWKPGQYAVFDFAKELSYGYEHMNDQQPQLLNDSFIRTWTITSQSDDIQITVRKSGVVSRYLASHKVEHGELTVPFLGISGDFGSGMSGKVLFIAGGIGITPFLTLGKDCNIALLYSGRLEDDALLEPLQDLSYKRCLHRRITKADIDAVPDSADRRIYCCGPPGLVEAVKAWTMKQVWTESFMY